MTDPPEGYREWLVELKSRIHSAQQRAFSKEWANFEIWRQAAAKLSWGHDISLTEVRQPSKIKTMNTPLPSPRMVLNKHRDELIRVLKQFHVTKAGVFGSTARGEDAQSSDIDLIVDFAPDAEKDLIRLAEQLSRAAGVPVDVVDAQTVFRRARETGVGTTILRETVPL